MTYPLRDPKANGARKTVKKGEPFDPEELSRRLTDHLADQKLRAERRRDARALKDASLAQQNVSLCPREYLFGVFFLPIALVDLSYVRHGQMRIQFATRQSKIIANSIQGVPSCSRRSCSCIREDDNTRSSAPGPQSLKTRHEITPGPNEFRSTPRSPAIHKSPENASHGPSCPREGTTEEPESVPMGSRHGGGEPRGYGEGSVQAAAADV